MRPAPADKPPAVPARSGFSLAELMIALIILGLGLLFIAAALPVGLSYTRDTIDFASGEAAGEYALDLIEEYVRTSASLTYTDGTGFQHRIGNLFRPRDDNPGQGYPANDGIEPWVRVRPLIMGNVDARPGSQHLESAGVGEEVIRIWLAVSGIEAPVVPVQVDFAADSTLSLAQNPGLPSVARVYPPITPDTVFRPDGFWSAPYAARPVRGQKTLPVGSEIQKALERRVVWTAFYRRVSYGSDSDPLLYEVMVVVVRRPSAGHRFPRQDLSDATLNTLSEPVAAPSTGYPIASELLAPEPWLVTFDPGDPNALPLLVENSDYVFVGANDRVLLPPPPAGTFNERSTLTFKCTREVGVLLPVGSVFVPAVNRSTGSVTGFVPHAPDALPVYKVLERPDDYTVVVENNGYYPWVSTQNPRDVHLWPVWVIPPAFRERDASGQPVFERRSPIVAVARRYIRLHQADLP